MKNTLTDHIIQIVVYIVLIAVVLNLPRLLAWVYNILVDVTR